MLPYSALKLLFLAIVIGIDTTKKTLIKTWQAFKRLTQLGFPQHFQIVQFPNLPLIIAFVTGRSSHYVHGTAHNYLLAVAYITMIIWAFEELVSGSNWFRHLLGIFFLIIAAMHLAHAL